MYRTERIGENGLVVTTGDVIVDVVTAIGASCPMRRWIAWSCHALVLGGTCYERRPDSEDVWLAHCVMVVEEVAANVWLYVMDISSIVSNVLLMPC